MRPGEAADADDAGVEEEEAALCICIEDDRE